MSKNGSGNCKRSRPGKFHAEQNMLTMELEDECDLPDFDTYSDMKFFNFHVNWLKEVIKDKQQERERRRCKQLAENSRAASHFFRNEGMHKSPQLIPNKLFSPNEPIKVVSPLNSQSSKYCISSSSHSHMLENQLLETFQTPKKTHEQIRLFIPDCDNDGMQHCRSRCPSSNFLSNMSTQSSFDESLNLSNSSSSTFNSSNRHSFTPQLQFQQYLLNQQKSPKRSQVQLCMSAPNKANTSFGNTIPIHHSDSHTTPDREHTSTTFHPNKWSQERPDKLNLTIDRRLQLQNPFL
jgi:hypothetical protein